MAYLPESELIINPDGSIYHLHLRPEQLADIVITVGDPDRVPMVSKYFDRVDEKVQKREFITHTGELKGHRISVISTGIGTDNCDIVLQELDALVNIDFRSRMPKPEHKPLTLIRIGTTGGLQHDGDVDSFVASSYGVGLDGLMHFYPFVNSANEHMVYHELMEYTRHRLNFPIRPYIAGADEDLINNLARNFTNGITLTCPGFYGPQGRSLRVDPSEPDMLDVLANFDYQGQRITNIEMETAALYGMANMLGHKAISFSVILANRRNGLFSKDPKACVDRLIREVLDLVSLHVLSAV